MDWNHYRFRARWDLAAAPGAVYEVLTRAEEYPRWWPQIRAVTALTDDTGVVRLRSALPYELAVTVRAVRQDPAAGVLEVAMRGDLVGWARWTVTPGGAGTRVRYDQEVEVHQPLMRKLAVPGRPLFRANHAVMMRAGRRGLVALLKERQQI
ncbi:SRPBCC family protein [Streptomyces sp. NPDC047315]|uniref:SRPBCC family protein n=1 Tax=Streptomyces sp. NPDC047315 TaxID=3155142 RepID=UPI0033E61990